MVPMPDGEVLPRGGGRGWSESEGIKSTHWVMSNPFGSSAGGGGGVISIGGGGISIGGGASSPPSSMRSVPRASEVARTRCAIGDGAIVKHAAWLTASTARATIERRADIVCFSQ